MDFDQAARGWEKWWPILERGTAPVSRRLIELAAVAPGDRVLDIATGLGEPALSAGERSGSHGEVVAVDISPQMIELARRRAERAGISNVRFVNGDAGAYADGTAFDAILSRWGLMFLPDLDASVRHYRAQLKPGGRIAAAVWGSPREVPLISLPMQVAATVFGEPPPAPQPNDPFSLHDVDMLQRRFADAGFAAVRAEDFTVTSTFDSAHQYLEHVSEIAPPVIALMQRLDDADRVRISAAIERAAGERFGRPDGSLEIPSRAVIVMATKE